MEAGAIRSLTEKRQQLEAARPGKELSPCDRMTAALRKLPALKSGLLLELVGQPRYQALRAQLGYDFSFTLSLSGFVATDQELFLKLVQDGLVNMIAERIRLAAKPGALPDQVQVSIKLAVENVTVNSPTSATVRLTGQVILFP